MIKQYNNFINENLLSKMKGKDEDVILNSILSSENPHQMLIKSAKVGLMLGIVKSIELGANIKNKTIFQKALYEATENKHLDIVKYLLNLNDDTINDGIVLVTANSFGHYDIVKYMIEKGVDINLENSRALRQAVLHCHIGVINLLIENGENVTDEIIINSQIYNKNNSEITDYLIKKYKE